MTHLAFVRGIAMDTPPGREATAVTGPACVLDSGVPWMRTGEELDREWARLRPQMALVYAKVAAWSDDSSFTPGERHAMGVYAAAVWTLGVTTEIPMGGSESPVTGQSIRRQLAEAEALMVSRRPEWEFGLGIVQWLLWITSGSEEPMSYFR